MKTPLILITNDDGYQAEGIQALTSAVSTFAEVYVVAPDGARSGAAASISSTQPVSFREVKPLPNGYPASVKLFACTGTPVDCIKLAWEQIVPRKPDLILSGINHGDNASISVHYSGTMGAVLEGCMKGIPSIGVSLWMQRGQRYEDIPVCDETLCALTALCQRVATEGLPEDICLNINIPPSHAFRGWQVCRQSRGLWASEWADATNPHGQRTFWLTGTFTDLEPEATDTDFSALRAGYCSIVPITIDMTAYAAMNDINSLIY